MKTIEFKVPIPEGMEIDKENSTFECIKFKPIKAKNWRNNLTKEIRGYFIDIFSNIGDRTGCNVSDNYNIFATKKQAKSALAMARISQIMANDKRFGGVVTDEEWNNPNVYKFCIERSYDHIDVEWFNNIYHFLAFHTKEQRDLFLKENKDLIKDYLMIK